MIKNAKILAFILLIATAAIVAVGCAKSTATSSNVNKKGPVDDPGNTAATAPANTGEKPKLNTYPLPVEVSTAEMKTLDGKPFKLEDMKGKVVLLNQWATWCGPCRMEIPELIKLSEEMHGQDFEVVGLALEDERQDKTDVKNYVQAQSIPYKIVMSTEDVWAQFGDLARFSVPASFVINRNGEITAIFIGYNPARTPKNVRKAVETAMNN